MTDRKSNPIGDDGIFLLQPKERTKEEMRTIEELRESYAGKLHVYCKDEETAQRFLIDAEAEGFKFGDIKPTENHTSDIYAVEGDKKIAYVNSVGRMAFQSDYSVRVDYAKYIAGDDKYIIRD